MASAAPAQYIGGSVVATGTGRPVLAIRVVAFEGKADVLDARTDSAGDFYLGPLKPGLYRLRIGDGTSAPFLSDTLRVSKDGFAQGRFEHDISGRRVYHEYEVAKPVAPLPGQRAPRYPADLRDAGVQGGVMAGFVVDTLGRAVDSSFSVLPGSDARFAAAVREGLHTIAFFPAQLPNGRKVSQYVHMPFQFSIR